MPTGRYLVSSISSEKCEEETVECDAYKCPSNLSFIDSSASSGFANVRSRTQIFETNKPPNIEHELNVAKSLMQQGSTITGDNLYDHLADLIKRVMDERPTNIVDYFEEFSHNVREQKFRIVERFPWIHYKPPKAGDAQNIFSTMKLPTKTECLEYDVCKEIEGPTANKSSLSSESTESMETPQRDLELNENVLRLHLYWMLSGFGFLTDEVLRLAYLLQKIQYQPCVEHARFWGKIYGIRKPYYIVEVKLTQCEMDIRLNKMKEEMLEKMNVFREASDQSIVPEENLGLIPGIQWQDCPETELKKMQPPAKPIPKAKVNICFDIPPEAVGMGLNRLTYFVVNSLDEEWIELPIVTPKQIQVSRKTKKFLTGDLEADVISYPNFPGTEKHYLRAMIARITSGTYIAPYGYYRRLTKRERDEMLGEEELEGEGNEEDFGEEEEEGDDLGNDAYITEDIHYQPNPRKLMTSKNWVHVRPHILDQGRVVYFNEREARKALEREAKLRARAEEEASDDENDEGIDEEEGKLEESLLEEDDIPEPDSGPVLFTPCNEDRNTEDVAPWTARYSSNYNKTNQLILFKSNLWPGAYSFTYEKYSDSIYLGWGYKYTARNISVPHIPPIQEDYFPDAYEEKPDPTVEMEEAWRLWQLKKQIHVEEFVDEEGEEENDSCYNTVL